MVARGSSCLAGYAAALALPVVLSAGFDFAIRTGTGEYVPYALLTSVAVGLLAHYFSWRHGIVALCALSLWANLYDEFAVGSLQLTSFTPGDYRRFLGFWATNIIVIAIINQRDTELVRLGNAEQRYDLAILGSNEGIWDWPSVDSDAEWWSPRFYELLGYREDEIEASLTSWREHLHPDDRERTLVAAEACFEDATPYDIEYRLKTKSGDYRWFHTKGNIIRDREGKPVRMCGTLRDINERRVAEAERDRTRDQLHRVQKLDAVGILAGGVAHDVNNATAAVVGYGELLRDDLPPGSKSRDYAEAILDAADRIDRLTNRILPLARRSQPWREQIEVVAAVREELDLIRLSLPSVVAIDFDPQARGAYVSAARIGISQILVNLCTNAAQAAQDFPEPEGPEPRVPASSVHKPRVVVNVDSVVLGATTADRVFLPANTTYVRLRVSDNGPGVDEALRAKIFDPFFTTKPTGQGTGLGLSVVYGVVTELGGSIEVTRSSRLGGAEFTVLLPAMIPDELEAVTEGVEAVKTGSGQRILVVDDDGMLAECTAKLVRTMGYEAEWVVDPKMALLRLRDAPAEFDLLLLDMTMPGLSGADLAREARLLRAHWPIVIVSGFGERRLERKAQELGLSEFLKKPFSSVELARALNAALSRSLARTATKNPRLPSPAVAAVPPDTSRPAAF